MPVGYIYDPIYLEHDTGFHVENANRLKSTICHLIETGLAAELTALSPRPATLEEITAVHDRRYIIYVEYVSHKGGAWLDADTVVSNRSYDAAVYAAGGAITAVDTVLTGRLNSAFALVRPPGHHAIADRAMGFCIFNNVAIAAKYAISEYGVQRVAIIDFDVHHGNGTQQAFETEPSVMFVSAHQHPHYPGSGQVQETGTGPAKGTKINLPLPAGCGDNEYLRAFEQIVAPVVRRFRPDLILVSAGYDAHWSDELAQMQLTTTGYANVVRVIKQLADELCGGRMTFTLEGGYNLPALTAGIRATFDVLLGKTIIEDKLGPAKGRFATPDISPLITELKRVHKL